MQATETRRGPTRTERGAAMAALQIPAVALGGWAKDFTLKDAYGDLLPLSYLEAPSGTLFMFICNQGPIRVHRLPG
jgi:hypothetical protein